MKLRNDVKMFEEGAPIDFLESILSTLAVDSQRSSMMNATHKNGSNQINNKRLSVSSVSIDEEMADMVKYQQNYNASARMITVYSQIYDTLINII